MVEITSEQKEYLSTLLPDLNDLIQNDTDEDLLLAVDDLIMDEYNAAQTNLSPKGVRLQKIYDEIFEAND